MADFLHLYDMMNVSSSHEAPVTACSEIKIRSEKKWKQIYIRSAVLLGNKDWCLKNKLRIPEKKQESYDTLYNTQCDLFLPKTCHKTENSYKSGNIH